MRRVVLIILFALFARVHAKKMKKQAFRRKYMTEMNTRNYMKYGEHYPESETDIKLRKAKKKETSEKARSILAELDEEAASAAVDAKQEACETESTAPSVPPMGPTDKSKMVIAPNMLISQASPVFSMLGAVLIGILVGRVTTICALEYIAPLFAELLRTRCICLVGNKRNII
eukprot:gnl/MRDRNA2_/MRDRNA2_43362_c0_seq1.p1 gnl/MRDRNA2_/MRDRNA2_43362_c0~~gnl/MRDRNA2_/MRDRNA2_43362_c0_seq1.p1  ORF type:complete len:173 (-),score=29.38 gnl/MRDRNA2_/MRDRNA2_43362_c0_seq1:72-590(-)